jgi:hypothetical protein
MNFLEKSSLHELDLSKIAWRCQDKAFFERVYTLLRARHVWNATLVSYAIKHESPEAAREWLLHQQAFVNSCGPILRNGLLSIDPEIQGPYEPLQYAPLINPRAHRVGSEWRIGNSAVYSQYTRMLSILAHKPHLERADKLAICAAMLLQDRITEAQLWFASLESNSPDRALQYDYMKATLDLLHGRVSDARTLAGRYTQYPVDRWRQLFTDLLNHLDISDGKSVPAGPHALPDREHETDQLAKTEPSLEAETGGKSIKIAVRNLRSIRLKFYPTDPEFSFSANPFNREDSGTFRFIQPAATLEKIIPEGDTEVTVPIPENLAATSLMVEVVGAGLRRVINFSPSILQASFVENYGRLDVREPASQRPVPKIYVKVYARLASGAVRFFKDGYTDIRGRFDYASLNSSKPLLHPVPRPSVTVSDAMQHPAIQPDEMDQVQKFAVLVVGETGGAVIREVQAPSRFE